MLEARSEERKPRIKSFTDLMAWQAAYKLSLAVYKATSTFPNTENIGLTSQMRRSSVSAASNIAEGFGRSGSKDKEYFYKMASGSLYELKNQVIIANGLEYLTNNTYDQLIELTDRAHKLLHGLLRAHRMSNIDRLTSKGGVHGEDF